MLLFILHTSLSSLCHSFTFNFSQIFIKCCLFQNLNHMTNITQLSTNFKATAFVMCIFKITSVIYSVKILGYLSYFFSLDLSASMQIVYIFHKLYFLLVQRQWNELLLYFYHWIFSTRAELLFHQNNFLYYKEKLYVGYSIGEMLWRSWGILAMHLKW